MGSQSPRRQQDEPVDFELVNALVKDLTGTLATLRPPFDQFDQSTLRTAFRAAFAAVEGITYYLKQEALRAPDEYTPDELGLLREENYALTPSGEVSVSHRRLPSAYNFVFAARMALRPLLPDIAIEPHDSGRLAFERAIQVRHRITHPKELRDLHITHGELCSLLEGFKWCYDLLFRFEQAVADLLAEGLEAINCAKEQLDRIMQDYASRQHKGDSSPNQDPPTQKV